MAIFKIIGREGQLQNLGFFFQKGKFKTKETQNQ